MINLIHEGGCHESVVLKDEHLFGCYSRHKRSSMRKHVDLYITNVVPQGTSYFLVLGLVSCSFSLLVYRAFDLLLFIVNLYITNVVTQGTDDNLEQGSVSPA